MSLDPLDVEDFALSFEFPAVLLHLLLKLPLQCHPPYLPSSYYIQSFSLTECIVVVRVRKTGGVCLSVCLCVCVCVCLWRAVWRNYWADFNQTYPNRFPNVLVVRICDLAH